MEIVKGHNLPSNTPVYFLVSWNSKPVCRSIDSGYVVYDGKQRRIGFYDYIFDSKDGLWATHHARDFWDIMPESHPNATLFDLLSQKLHISSLKIL
jgi:hypothetical protein